MNDSQANTNEEDELSTEALYDITMRNLNLLDYEMLDHHYQIWVMMMETLCATMGGVIVVYGLSVPAGFTPIDTFIADIPDLVHVGFVLMLLVSLLLKIGTTSANLLVRHSEQKQVGITAEQEKDQ